MAPTWKRLCHIFTQVVSGRWTDAISSSSGSGEWESAAGDEGGGEDGGTRRRDERESDSENRCAYVLVGII